MWRAISKRLAGARQFAGIAGSFWDVPSAAIAGIARQGLFDGKTPFSKIAKRCFPRLRIHPRVLGGAAVELDTSDLGQLVSFEEVYVEKTYKMALVPFTPDWVIDCGAHVGFFSLLALAAFPDARVMAFEPNPENLNGLRQHLDPFSSRVEIHAAAVSSVAGERHFSAVASNGGCLSSDDQGDLSVRVESLAEPLNRMEDCALLLKLDVEGEEVLIAPAIAPILPRKCAIFFETHGDEPAWSLVAKAWSDVGFDVVCLRDKGRYRDGFAIRGQN